MLQINVERMSVDIRVSITIFITEHKLMNPEDQKNTGAGAAVAAATAQEREEAVSPFFAIGKSFSVWLNKQIGKIPTLKIPYKGKEWRVVDFVPDRGLKLEEPTATGQYDYVALDAKMIATLLPMIAHV